MLREQSPPAYGLGRDLDNAFTAEAAETARVRQVSEDYRRANGEAIRYSSAFVPLIRMAILAGFTSTLLVGGRLVLDGHLEGGLYSVLVFMTQRLLWPLTYLGETLDLYQRAMASTRRILDLLAVESTMPPGTGALPAPGSASGSQSPGPSSETEAAIQRSLGV